MKRKIRIIINPISGTGKQEKAEKAIKTWLDTSLFDSELMYSQHKGHLTLLAREAAEKGYDAVIVVGGDGSINEAIQGLVGTKTTLGILPVGSGNALARHLEIPMSLSRSIKRLNQFKVKKIDTATLNEKTFVSIAGIGFDAEIAKQFSYAKKRGLWNYVKISVCEFFRYSEKEYQINLDGVTFKKDAFMIVFANANQFGNNFIISPEGKIDDGSLDVCFVKKPALYQVPSLFIKLFQKKIHQSRLVNIIQAKQVEVEIKKRVFVNLDGESISESETINITINPLSLSVII